MASFFQYRNKEMRHLASFDLRDEGLITRYSLKGRRSHFLNEYHEALNDFSKSWNEMSYHERMRRLSGKRTVHDINRRYGAGILADRILGKMPALRDLANMENSLMPWFDVERVLGLTVFQVMDIVDYSRSVEDRKNGEYRIFQPLPSRTNTPPTKVMPL